VGDNAADQSYGAVVHSLSAGARLYLLVLHAVGAHWDFPKGHPHRGESTGETVRREVREETGCRIALVPGFEESIRYTLPGGEEKQVTFYLARPRGPAGVKLPNDEIRGIGWFTFAEASRTITYDNSREVLARAEAFLDAR